MIFQKKKKKKKIDISKVFINDFDAIQESKNKEKNFKILRKLHSY